MKQNTTHVLVYHATFQQTPGILREGLHNVAPDVLYQQLSWIKSHFDVARIDDLFTNGDIRGKAAITIDDGYSSFLLEGFPVFKALDIPCTLFLCGSTLQGKIFWRDKVRYLINNHLVGALLDFFKKQEMSDWGLTKNNFYKKSKSPEINSRLLNASMDEFFEKKDIALEHLNFCVKQEGDLIADPLLSYGNHSFDHYVLSSLSEDEQENQIGKNHAFLGKGTWPISKVFSVPFGGFDHFNDGTLAILKGLGYLGFLLTHGKINKSVKKHNNFRYLNRYLPAENFTLFKKNIRRMRLRQLFHFS